MKTTVTAAAAGLLLLSTLALSSPAPAMGTVTPAQDEWASNLVIPPCVDKCVSGPALVDNPEKYMPPCAYPYLSGDGQEQEDESQYIQQTIALVGCICTDRIYVSAVLDCVLDKCASPGTKNATANIEAWMEMWYAQCDYNADIRYPEPPSFVEALCLKDTFEKKVEYPDMKGFEKAWGNYEYLADGTWPEAPKATQTLPADTRKQLDCTVGGADLVVSETATTTKDTATATATATGTATTTGKGNATKTGSGAIETGAANAVGVGMSVVAVAVAAMAVVL